MQRLAIYARVSTPEQTLDPQLDVLRGYAGARCWAVEREYLDEGVSGAKDRRPALDQLLADARRRRFDAVAVVKLDRLARSVKHLTSMVAELEALGVDLIVLDQGIDTSTPAGKLLFHVIGAIAEFERDLLSERTSAGMRAARRRGKRIGRPRVQISHAEVHRGIRSGESIVSIAKRLEVSRSVVRRVLTEAGLSKRVSAAESYSAGISGTDTPANAVS